MSEPKAVRFVPDGPVRQLCEGDWVLRRTIFVQLADMQIPEIGQPYRQEIYDPAAEAETKAALVNALKERVRTCPMCAMRRRVEARHTPPMQSTMGDCVKCEIDKVALTKAGEKVE